MPGRKSVKISDSHPGVSFLGRQHRYWSTQGFTQKYKRFRPGLSIPKNIDLKNQKTIAKSFHILGFEYGNWMPQEERYNDLASLVVALIDLNSILRFNNNIGFDKLGVAFGARGQGGSAIAHFEPYTYMINLTRYGGAGCFAHEYGHALDYFFGMYIEPIHEYSALTNARSIGTHPVFPKDKNSLRYAMAELITAIIWEKPYGKKSSYYEGLKKKTKGEYWFRQTELFARAFEQYIQHKLKKKRVINTFLHFKKYDSTYYMSPSEVKRLEPYFNKLLLKMRKVVNA